MVVAFRNSSTENDTRVQLIYERADQKKQVPKSEFHAPDALDAQHK